ncbi:type 1 secretion target domain-containing [Chlorella sorokiniana]|uniref:Type 1 secretion target domain-containing n=1 Tax=Chlorella sorokiniana TaxID=3076 RepID=A0A2P6U246_CHLSO|nr:type 1 secretion target domain-containing [Chlorella sorokiniana]|eukprot:PRW60393.1 type 1 secretion target domain-containing [Chlorella sorokiniana]
MWLPEPPPPASQASGSSAVPPPRLAAAASQQAAAGSSVGRRLTQQQLTPEQLAVIQQQQARQQQQQQASDADVPAHQHVPVLLSIGYGGPAVTAPPTSPRILDASTVNTTRCIRYADWYDPASPGTSREPNTTDGSSGSGSSEQQAGAAAVRWRRPPLDLSACQRSVLEVLTASQRVLVQVRLNAPMVELPPDALSVTAGEVLHVAPPFVQGAFMVFPVTIQLADPNVRCNVSIAAGALSAAAGEPTAASNTLSLLWDLEGPQPRINTVGRYAAASTPRIPLLLDFGERVAMVNPLGLFTARGFGRTDVVYDVSKGRLFLIGTIPDPLQDAVVTVEVPAAVTTDIIGNPNKAATYTLVYSPASNSSAAVGTGMNYMFAASAASYGLGIAGAAVGSPMVVMPIGNDFGAMAGRIQAVYLTGQLNIPTLPSNFRATADQLSYISVNFPLPSGLGGSSGSSTDKKKKKQKKKDDKKKAGQQDEGEEESSGGASGMAVLGGEDLDTGDVALADLLSGGLTFPAKPVGVAIKRSATGGIQLREIPSPSPPELPPNLPPPFVQTLPPPPEVTPSPPAPSPPGTPPDLFTPSKAAGAGMYSVQGSQLYTYNAGEKAGPFDLSGLLDLVNGGNGGRRRLLGSSSSSSSGLSISSLDYDGGSLWVVLSNGAVYSYTVRSGQWAAVPDAGPASVVTLTDLGVAWLIDQAGSQLVRYLPASQGGSNRWDLPGGSCTDVAVSSSGLVAVVCSSRVLVARVTADVARFATLGGVSACAVAFDSEDYLLFSGSSRSPGLCSGVGFVTPSELGQPFEATGHLASDASCDDLEAGSHSDSGSVVVYCFQSATDSVSRLELSTAVQPPPSPSPGVPASNGAQDPLRLPRQPRHRLHVWRSTIHTAACSQRV